MIGVFVFSVKSSTKRKHTDKEQVSYAMFQKKNFHFSVMSECADCGVSQAWVRQGDRQEAVLALAVAVMLGLGDHCGGRTEEGDFTLPLF